MLESALERKFQTGLRKTGVVAWKFVSPGRRGVPDRIVLMPWGQAIFVELKRKGENPTAIQKVYHRMLRKMCFDVRVLQGKQDVEDFVNEVRALVVSKYRDGVDPVTSQIRAVSGDGAGKDSGYTDRCKETP